MNNLYILVRGGKKGKKETNAILGSNRKKLKPTPFNYKKNQIHFFKKITYHPPNLIKNPL